MKTFLSYLKPYRRQAVLAVLCIEAEAAFELVIPPGHGPDYRRGRGKRRPALHFDEGASDGSVRPDQPGAGPGIRPLRLHHRQGLGAEIRKAEFQKLQQFSFANTDKFRTSSLVTRLTSDVTTIQNSVSTGMRPAFRSPVMMLIALTVSFYHQRQTGPGVFCGRPAVGRHTLLHCHPCAPPVRPYAGVRGPGNRVIQENLTAIRVVKSYCPRGLRNPEIDEVNTNLQNTSEPGLPPGRPQYAGDAVHPLRHHLKHPLVRWKLRPRWAVSRWAS